METQIESLQCSLEGEVLTSGLRPIPSWLEVILEKFEDLCYKHNAQEDFYKNALRTILKDGINRYCGINYNYLPDMPIEEIKQYVLFLRKKFLEFFDDPIFGDGINYNLPLSERQKLILKEMLEYLNNSRLQFQGIIQLIANESQQAPSSSYQS